jgi:hypothetical protein
MKITTMAAITALAPASPVMAQQEHPMSPGDSGAGESAHRPGRLQSVWAALLTADGGHLAR